MPDPGASARAFRVARIVMLEADDFGIPAFREFSKVDLDHLAAADSDRIADLGNLVVIAPPVVLPAKMAQVFAAAQLDHGEVPGPVRPLGRDPAFERRDAFGREVAACAHVILMPVEKLAVPAAGLVVLHAMRG